MPSFTTIVAAFSVIFVAAQALPEPIRRHSANAGIYGTCAENTKVSCCSTGGNSASNGPSDGSSGGLLDGLLGGLTGGVPGGATSGAAAGPANGLLGRDNILGGSCLLPNILSLGSLCSGQNTYCCPVNQDGLIDVSLTCSPISL